MLPDKLVDIDMFVPHQVHVHPVADRKNPGKEVGELKAQFVIASRIMILKIKVYQETGIPAYRQAGPPPRG